MTEHPEPNWEALRAEYETGTDTYETLAEKNGLPAARVRARARAERWNAARKQYRKQVAQSAVGRCAETESEKLACVLAAVSGISGVIAQTAADEKQFFRYQVKCKAKCAQADGEPVEKVWAEEQELQTMDIHAVKDYLSALKQLTELIRELYDIPTAEGKLNRRLLKQKLKSAETAKNGKLQVVFAPELEEFGA